MRKIKLAELILDFDVYPRTDVDKTHVHYIVEALQAGSDMPAIIIDKKSKRIVDGFHRYKAYSRLYDPNHEVLCIEKVYKSEAELFLDTMRYNSGHGRTLTKFDRTHCALRSKELKISVDEVASALKLTMEAVGELTTERVGELSVDGKRNKIPLKRTIKHMSGRTLTKEQAEANEKLSGMNQLFYVNQLITLIKSDLLDYENQILLERIKYLEKLLGSIKKAA